MIQKIVEKNDHASMPRQATVEGRDSVNLKFTSPTGRFLSKMSSLRRNSIWNWLIFLRLGRKPVKPNLNFPE